MQILSFPSVQLWLALFFTVNFACFGAETSLADLERAANEVLADPDNVSRRKRITPVFELADRYVATGETNKALSYFSKALEHYPWNLQAQVTVAELLHRRGETNQARDKAMLVFSRGETDAVLARAAKILGASFDAKLPEPEPWPANTNVLALVPVGEIDGWLVQDLRRDLQNILQIPVIIRPTQIVIPKPGRDALRQKADDLRDKISKAETDRAFRTLLRQHNLSTKGLDDDAKVFALAEKILETESDKEPARRFREELAFLRRLGPQWDSIALLNQMKPALAPVGGSPRGYLGVTKLDLYANQNRFVFGMAENGMNCGVLSYWRYTSSLAEEPPNRDRLRERTLKQALSSTGLLFGLPRCTEPTCARAYANGLTEHDSKQAKLCSVCVEAFAKRFAN